MNVSSEELADLAGVNAAKVRKDLSYLGTYGTRGVGYEVEYLIYQVRRELGLPSVWIDRPHTAGGASATPAPSVDVAPAWRFESLAAFADAAVGPS